MRGNLKILMVFPEIMPFAGKADVGHVGNGLPKSLKDLGHDVRIISPQYREINERKYVLRDVIRLQNIEVPLDKEVVNINVKSAFLPNSKVQVYFIDYKPFFFREGLYADKKSGKSYADNDKRFILFSKGVLETLKKLQWQPDVIHAHDWQASLIPFLLRETYAKDAFFSHICSLLTVHDFSVQGQFSPECQSYLSVDPPVEFEGSDLEYNGNCNFLAAGIRCADLVNTVSPAYADQVRKDPAYGFGLIDVIKSRGEDFSGILNGLDDAVWDPAKDSVIPKPFHVQELEGKQENRKALLDKVQLPDAGSSPVVAMMAPFVSEKGIDIVQDVLDEMMKLDIVFILVGDGDAAITRFFKAALKKYEKRMRVHAPADDALKHLILAGADMLLLPYKVEPCGMDQIYALKYGTVPVAHATGGLADTIQNYDPETGKGTGFVYRGSDGKKLIRTLKRSIRAYKDSKTWIQIMKNGMRADFSWNASAKRYVQLYNKCASKR